MNKTTLRLPGYEHFGFYIDEKVTVWNRTHYTIEAKTYEAAKKHIKDFFTGKGQIEPEPTEHETLYDSEQLIPPTDKEETKQLFDYQTDKLLLTNKLK